MQVPFYITAQLVGSILASGALYLLLSPRAEHFYGTTPVGSPVQSFVFEIIISFSLMFVISGVTTDTRAVSTLFVFFFRFLIDAFGSEKEKKISHGLSD